jgi:signal transduction histidine kinase
MMLTHFRMISALGAAPPAVLFVVGCLLTGLVALSDYVTGPYAWWAAMYVPPVVMIAWLSTRGIGHALSILGGLCSFGVNEEWSLAERHPIMPFWNGFVVYATCIVLVYTLVALRDALRARERLMSMVSHDVNNIITSISINAEMLASKVEGAGFQFHTEAIREASQRMKRIVEDLASFSKVSGRSLKLQTAPSDLVRSLRNIEELYRPVAEKNGIELAVEGFDGAVMISADESRLSQVWDNLFSNAIKFTPHGGKISLVLKPQRDSVEVQIRDSGPCIDPALRERVFESFWKGSETAQGTGLGLYISKTIVELHGGRIWVDGSSGCIFHVRLPRVS